MKKRVIIAICLVVLVIVAAVLWPRSARECVQDSDCVAKSCCHATECTNIANKPDCSGTFCSQTCETSLDCGQASCVCLNNKCKVSEK